MYHEDYSYEKLHLRHNKALAQKNILLVGLGSGGNDIALDLTRMGAGCKVCSEGKGKLILIDPDKLMEGNLMLYSASNGIKDLHNDKVDIVARKMSEFNPDIKVVAHPISFEHFISRFPHWYQKIDMVISATGSVQTNLYIYRKSAEHNIPFYESCSRYST